MSLLHPEVDMAAMASLPMPPTGTTARPLICAGTVVLEQGRVLLTKRPDFEVWCLPGGMVEVGESLAGAAARETLEETGLRVRIDGLVGVYSELGGWTDVHACIFAATRIGGAIGPSPEALAVDWVDAGHLPEDFFWWQEAYVDDAVNARRGVVRSQRIESPGRQMTRAELYEQMANSGLAPSAFFRTAFPRPDD